MPIEQNSFGIKNILAIGALLFSMFFGAGNLIFPPYIGYLAGQNIWITAIGFLVTGVGLPLLSLIVICRVGGGFNALTEDLPSWLMSCLGLLVFLILGPLYVTPRTAIVSYNIAIAPLLNQSNWNPEIIKLTFNTIFFIVVAWFSLYPGELLDKVGKILVPLLIIVIGMIIVTPFIAPSQTLLIPSALPPYNQNPFVHGFLSGYATMDALGAFMFGIVIMTNLKSHGICQPKTMVKYASLAGLQAAIGLAIIYLGLFNVGLHTHGLSTNSNISGTIILNTYIQHYFGVIGSILLSIIMILACITTAIGAITATGEYIVSLFKKRVAYKILIWMMSILCIIIAMQNLDHIMNIYQPILLVLYPICMCFLILNIVKIFLKNRINTKIISRCSVLIVFIFSLTDSFLPLYPELASKLSPYLATIPGYNNHMSWLIPGILTILITLCISYVQQVIQKKRQ